MAETYKQRMLAVLSGQSVERILGAAARPAGTMQGTAGTLPAEYQASLAAILDDLGWGYHAVVPEFRTSAGRGRGRTAAGHLQPPRHAHPNDARRRATPNHRSGDRTFVEYRTPVGNLTTGRSATTPCAAGSRSRTSWATHSAGRKTTRVEIPLQHAAVEPNIAGYIRWAEQIGQRGFATAFLSLAASPIPYPAGVDAAGSILLRTERSARRGR